MINMGDQQNEHLLSMVDQMKLELIKNDVDMNRFRLLWTKTFNIRRLFIRESQINEILERFPGYHRPEMVKIFSHRC